VSTPCQQGAERSGSACERTPASTRKSFPGTRHRVWMDGNAGQQLWRDDLRISTSGTRIIRTSQ